MKGSSVWTALALMGALGFFTGAAWAQAWKPEKPVEIVTSSAAGGSNDRVARMIQLLTTEIDITIGHMGLTKLSQLAEMRAEVLRNNF